MPFYPGQVRIIRNARRFNVVACGRRFGETAMGCIIAMTGWPGFLRGVMSGYDIGWFAPNYKLLDEVWRTMRFALGAQRATTRVDGQRYRIETPFGGALDFWTLEDTDAGRSRGYGLVIIDEAAMVRYLKVA